MGRLVSISILSGLTNSLVYKGKFIEQTESLWNIPVNIPVNLVDLLVTILDSAAKLLRNTVIPGAPEYNLVNQRSVPYGPTLLFPLT